MAIYYSDGSNSTAGRQVQLVKGTTGTYTQITATSYQDVANHYLDITPKENGNILIGSYTMYINNRDNAVDTRISVQIVEVFSGTTQSIYYPNLNEGVDSHQWIHIAAGSGTTDFDNWIPITLCWSYTLPGSGRAGNSHRYKVMAKNNGGNFKTLGASMMIQEINA